MIRGLPLANLYNDIPFWIDMENIMKTIVLAFFITFTCIAGTIWNWDLTQLPEGWEANEYWSFDIEGAHSYVEASTYGPYSESETAQMYSDTMTVPDSVDCMVVNILDEWNYSGWWSNGESSCVIWFRLSPLEADYYTIEFDSHYWGFIRINDEKTTSVLIPLAGGEEFYLDFYSRASSSYGAGAEMAWDISNLQITDTTTAALEHSTWGQIKREFN